MIPYALSFCIQNIRIMYTSGMKWFQFAVTCVFFFFIGLMMTVVYIAQTRTSGRTGIDAGQIQAMRIEGEKAAKQ